MATKYGNAIVGQSGGPTSVINASLAGVFRTAKDLGYQKIYGMRNGIEGLLKERYVDLSEHIRTGLDLELLKRTPSTYLGSCRYKLPFAEQDGAVYEKLFAILKKLDIRHFFYIGGNDSMDTIAKLSDYAKDSDITFIGIPKTIDNDLGMTDHTPGYGSAAKYIAASMKEIVRDTNVYDMESIGVVEIMGRNAGWLAAASVLSRGEDCDGPDLIYLPESVFDYNDFLSRIQELKKRKKALVIAVSEGIRTADGAYVCEQNKGGVSLMDPFGHKLLGGTALYLSDFITRELGIKSRGIVFSTLQRCASHLVSRCDITEAYAVAAHGVRIAGLGETGKMTTLLRIGNDPYQTQTGCCDVREVANFEKTVPQEWISAGGTDVSKAFVDYAKPLIIGELDPFMVDGLPRHSYLPN
ncbi:pyrophosphate--fructose 6-phosphate 1-phosphotransferase [Clostridia bacterium]|nr:pyrophosphate--fructose 6-phosphate 1-phosphotransferase [Clostridia bacterium]